VVWIEGPLPVGIVPTGSTNVDVFAATHVCTSFNSYFSTHQGTLISDIKSVSGM
jgi:hypothetical protein